MKLNMTLFTQDEKLLRIKQEYIYIHSSFANKIIVDFYTPTLAFIR